MTSFAQTLERLPQWRWILLCDMGTHLTERDLWAISKRPYHTLKQINSHPTVTEGDKWKMCYIAGTTDFDHYNHIMFIRQVTWNQVYLRNTKHSKVKSLLKIFSTNCIFSKNLYLDQKTINPAELEMKIAHIKVFGYVSSCRKTVLRWQKRGAHRNQPSMVMAHVRHAEWTVRQQRTVR